jgi:hypothetical protein
MGIGTTSNAGMQAQQQNTAAYMVNLDGVEAVQGGGDFTPLPDDKYYVEIVKADPAVSAKGNAMIKLEMEVRQDANYDNRKVWDIVTVVPTSKFSMGRLRAFLEATGTGIPKGAFDIRKIAPKLIGTYIGIQTKNKEEEYNGETKTRTRVVAYFPFDDGTGTAATGNSEEL